MNRLGPYDGKLQMFVQPPREADLRRLQFLRWLAEHGKLEHEVAGPPCGAYAVARSEPDEAELAVAA